MVAAWLRCGLSGKNMVNLAQFKSEGFLLLPEFLDYDGLTRLEGSLNSDRFAQRNLLENSIVREFAASLQVRELMSTVLGDSSFAVRAILFDKTPAANWNLGWHQDCVVPVRERKDVEGFRGWSVKKGVLHVQAPAAIMERMAALRVHLDDCPESNGALQVLAGSHRNGVLTDAAVMDMDKSREVVCAVFKGGALVMHSLLLHASSPSASPAHRRILHIDFAATELPGGLEWHSRIS